MSGGQQYPGLVLVLECEVCALLCFLCCKYASLGYNLLCGLGNLDTWLKWICSIQNSMWWTHTQHPSELVAAGDGLLAIA